MARRQQRGFTLVEVLLVTSIVLILAAFSIPGYAAYRSRAFDAQVASTVRNVAGAEEAYFADRETYSSDVSALPLPSLGAIALTIGPGRSGDLRSSFTVHGTHPGAGHAFTWVSDPAPGQPHLIDG